MLRRIQEYLERLYDLEVRERVEDFVCDGELAQAMTRDALERGEVLLVHEHLQDVSVGLYVDPQAVDALRRGLRWWNGPRGFRAFCLTTEGVSHFVYLMFRAKRELPVTQLELEIQAEVDKYAFGLLEAPHRRPPLVRSRMLRSHLYAAPRFMHGADTEEGRRYRIASRVAARYTEQLEFRYVAAGDEQGLHRALRRFYRLGAKGKMEAAEHTRAA
ncbi:MAG: hypothetical protein ACOC97_04820 [Myxococcota bacterium]